MQFKISFSLNSFSDLVSALEFVYPFIRVPIGYFMANQSFPEGTNEFDLTEVVRALKQHADKTFTLAEEGTDWVDNRNKVSFHRHQKQHTEYFVLSLETGDEVRVEELLLTASARGLTFAYKYDALKAYWQSAELVNQYETGKRPHAHLKKIIDPRLPPIIGHKVDISENPGHQRLTYTMQLMAAPEMWFGPGCWAWFDKQRVASFPDAQETRWLESEILYVRLFDWNTPDYEAGKILHLQERFRKWVGMDEVEARLQQMI